MHSAPSWGGRLCDVAWSKGEARRLQRTPSLIASGGLIEAMVAWLDGRLESSADQVIDDYTRLSTALLAVALPD
jgi:hypothetical protein